MRFQSIGLRVADFAARHKRTAAWLSISLLLDFGSRNDQGAVRSDILAAWALSPAVALSFLSSLGSSISNCIRPGG